MTIKKNIKTIIMGLLIVTMGALFYQETRAINKETTETGPLKDDFGILLRKGEHLKVAVRTAEEVQNNPKFNRGRFEIIVCGKEVEKLKKGSELTDTLEKAKEMGVEVKACGISLQKFGVSTSSLQPGIEVIPNGLMRAFELEKEGYLMIEL
ncbi:hypothetical protein C900_02450 [Fulvivirga imtechensis AK7]|uniref:Uncharacterized protein n=1 Tax=Fulvivirga imtechensis AK7 TaxID=1237149 RepID=L8JWQ8_9BACT|nr:DsrE family protein [Fulvivirga imtechensis]ELR71642.1 hypothetical protein C900_02450 [Fulvivirga imtechensis AK7]